MKKTYSVTAPVWEYPGFVGWHFVHIGRELSEKIDALYSQKKKGFGSLPVSVTLGTSTWETSIFPSKKDASYLLALKASVRKKEGVFDGDTITFSFQIRNI